ILDQNEKISKDDLFELMATPYILSGITTSAFVADVNIAIPLIRKSAALGIKDVFVLMDKGYDVQSIYQEAHHLKL
ncbi:MAG: hypothetical protein ACRCXQ_14900, partial [Vagococcus fluvialis]